MAFFGSLIKKGIELNRVFKGDEKPARYLQEEQLKILLRSARNTAFGKFYGFENILRSDDLLATFQHEVPIFDYNRLHEQWWHKQQELPDITWPGKPNYFALSSGTTGKSSKRIPITDEFLQSMRDVGTSLVKDLPNFDFPESLFESEILMLTSSANLSRHKHGHKEGEISGINVSNFPGWYDIFYRPGKEIASIPDWDERVKHIAKEAPSWNIGAIAGIPSWVLLMLKEVMDYNKLDSIHDIWPNLSVYASGGVAFETYRKDFEKITKKSLAVMDTYLASEGFFSYTARPNTMAMKLALSHGYFYEFIPFDENGVDGQGEVLDNPQVLTIDQVETQKDYVLVVSTCAGAWRYIMGDTIRFTNLTPHEILITGRTKFFLNVVGSQLSEEKLDDAILELSEQLQVDINEYSVAALKDDSGEYYHQWVLITHEPVNESQAKEVLDKYLQSANKNYQVARSKALKGIAVTRITKETYLRYLEQGKKKGGQVKTPKVMEQTKMQDFLKFVNS